MLTRKQSDLLEYLTFSQATGKSPSYEEMQNRLGLSSKSGVARLIQALEERGFIERLPNRARAIRVLAEPKPYTPTAIPVASSALRKVSTVVLKREMEGRGYVCVRWAT